MHKYSTSSWLIKSEYWDIENSRMSLSMICLRILTYDYLSDVVWKETSRWVFGFFFTFTFSLHRFIDVVSDSIDLASIIYAVINKRLQHYLCDHWFTIFKNFPFREMLLLFHLIKIPFNTSLNQKLDKHHESAITITSM